MNWIVFVYKVPTTPTKYRAHIWREIKKIGALYLQDGVCIVPDMDDVQLFIGALGEKAVSFGGTEFTFRSTVMSDEKNKEMIDEFNRTREKEYLELVPIIEEIEGNIDKDTRTLDEDQVQEILDSFRKTTRKFQIIEARDYFDTEISKEIRFLLDACRKKMIRFL